MPGAEERAKRVEFPERFEVACRYQERVLPLETTSEIGVKERLLLYALRQQAREGKNETPAPSWWHTTDRAKWDAWAALSNMSSMEAMVYFTKTLDELRPDWLVAQLEYEDAQAAAPPAAAGPRTPPRVQVTAEPSPQAKAAQRSPIVGVEVLRQQPAQPGGADEAAALQVLRRQVDALQYRLTCALRDVQCRDDLVAELRSENAALRRLLAEHGVAAPAPSASSAAGQLLFALDRIDRNKHERMQQQPQPDTLSGAGSPTHATTTADYGGNYYQPVRKQGWLSWLTGSADYSAGDVRI
eukprot:TRINITY_DN8572_c2_g1_i2.p1 TRINITY_DN8572_c2_g1~~TRINITY_DN8572_c2_g1_i2.p1  ORF type:complete len:299 (+),score=95.70 TRINITY_DN8572_c2_g1_i2:65-961(+)